MNGVVADNVPVPITVAPSRKFTVPVGFATVVLPVTVAVKVTLWPKTEGFADDARVVVVVAFVTARGSQVAMAGLLLVSPLYVALKLKEPVGEGVVADESGTTP